MCRFRWRPFVSGSSNSKEGPPHDIRNLHGAPGWTGLSTPDPEAAQAFLSAVFGWTFENMPTEGGDYAVGAVHGHGVGGVRAPQPDEDAAPTWRAYVAIEDAAELVRRVEETGGSLLMEPFDLPEVGRLVAFQHPAAGRLLALEYLRPFS